MDIDKLINKYQDEINYLNNIVRTPFGDDSLRTYQVFLKELYSINNWVDCKIEKPKEGIHVLVDGGVAYYCGSNSGRYEWRSASNNYIIEWDVTHWMSLPKLNIKKQGA